MWLRLKAMGNTILFPGDYFSMHNPNDNFTAELDAVVATEDLDAALFNYDEFIEGASLRLSKEPDSIQRDVIYRGWMMKPDQYRRFYDELKEMGLEPFTSPVCYERMHCFPYAGEMFDDQTPKFMVFPIEDGAVHIDADIVNANFNRFMFKDYVKSVKGTSFPKYVTTPIAQSELDALVSEFIRLRGDLFTGGIVLKEYVGLKTYDGHTNEWRNFIFNGVSLGIRRNSNQPEDCPAPPEEYLSTRNIVICPFYTVDYAELADGGWTIMEAGDGQVSGLAASDNPTRFYEEMARRIKIDEAREACEAVW